MVASKYRALYRKYGVISDTVVHNQDSIVQFSSWCELQAMPNKLMESKLQLNMRAHLIQHIG